VVDDGFFAADGLAGARWATEVRDLAWGKNPPHRYLKKLSQPPRDILLRAVGRRAPLDPGDGTGGNAGELGELVDGEAVRFPQLPQSVHVVPILF